MAPLTAAAWVGLAAGYLLVLTGTRVVQRGSALRPALYLLLIAGLAAAAVSFAQALLSWLPADTHAHNFDMSVFYQAGNAAWHRQPLYDLDGIRQDPGRIVVYRHAPIGAVIFAPLSRLPLVRARDLWYLLNMGMYLGTLALLLRYYRVGWREPLALSLATLWLSFAPSRFSLSLGQWDTIFMLLVTLALVLQRHGHDRWAGVCLALPVAIKYYPLLLLLASLRARRYGVLIGTAAGFATLTLAGAVGAGLANTRIFFTQVIPALGGATLYQENQAPYAFFGRLLATSLSGNGTGAPHPELLTRALAGLVSLLVLAGTLLALRRLPVRAIGADLRFVLPLAAALLMVPTAWGHYVTWTLPAIAVLTVALNRWRLSWACAGGLLLGGTLLAAGTELGVWGPGPHDGLVRLILTYKLYGLLALWLGLVLAARQVDTAEARRQAAPAGANDVVLAPAGAVLGPGEAVS